MKSILEDIKTENYKKIYLLYGEESYLLKQYRDKLRKALVSEEDTMNFTYFEGKGIEVPKIIDLCETLPFFADRRLVIIENSGFFKNKNEAMAEYLTQVPESTYLVFVETEIDKRSKMFKVVKDKGRAVEFPRQDENTLSRWILSSLGKENKKITKETMEYFIDKTGIEMFQIESELEKVICYVGDREIISKEDVEAICSTRITNKIFEMVRGITEKKQKKALELYYDLLALKEPPMRILFLIAREFRILSKVKEISELGYDNTYISKQAGIPPFAVKNYLPYARKYSKEALRTILEECLEMEEFVKTGRMDDQLSVEMIIVKYSQ